VILDATKLYGFFVQNSPGHWGVVGEVEFVAGFEELVVSPFVVAELESVIRERVGEDGWLAALDQLASGAWTIAAVDPPHLAAMREFVERGQTLAGASVAVLLAS
jgi:hypothetical protein